MAKITTITNPLTGQPAQVDQLDHTAQQIDDGLNIARGVSNPNLLDNWYFGNPINQRGQTSYTGAGYGIDRWITDIDAGGGITITDNGIVIASAGTYWGTRLDNIARLSGKTVTGSILMSKGTLYSGTIESVKWQMDAAQTIFSNTDITLYINKVGDDKAQVEISTGRAGVGIKAVKLELGSQQTIAHQENGVWVLNEIPDYGEQLARCQRYQLVLDAKNYGSPYACFGTGFHIPNGTPRSVITVPIPATLRSKPSISYNGNIMILYGSTEVAVTNLYVDTVSANSLQLIAECSGPASGDATALWIRNDAGGKIILDANM